jgi:hypothetical protein
LKIILDKYDKLYYVLNSLKKFNKQRKKMNTQINKITVKATKTVIEIEGTCNNNEKSDLYKRLLLISVLCGTSSNILNVNKLDGAIPFNQLEILKDKFNDLLLDAERVTKDMKFNCIDHKFQ